MSQLVPATELAPLNPFSTRAFRSGRLPYWDPAQRLPQLEQRFGAAGGQGAVIGPHGSGKTALVAAVAAAWTARRLEVRWLSILKTPAGPSLEWKLPPAAMPAPAATLTTTPFHTAWIVDGYDALRARDRWGLAAYCRQRQIALLVTAHASTNLPTVAQTATSLEMFLYLASQLQRQALQPLSPTELAACYAAAGGHLREALFHAYDRYQQRR